MLLRRKKVRKERVLEHPTTLKLYLYLKAKEPEEIGIREAQRALGLKSSSTIAWHLEKLEESEYVKKLPSNRYQLTEKGTQKHSLSIPVLIPARTIKGLMIPRILFLLGFLLTSFVTALITYWYSHIIAIFIGIASLFVGSLLVFYEYLQLRKQFRFYRFLSEEKE